MMRLGAFGKKSGLLPPSAKRTNDTVQVLMSPSPSMTPNVTGVSVSGLEEGSGFPMSYAIAIVIGVVAAVVVLAIATIVCYVS